MLLKKKPFYNINIKLSESFHIFRLQQYTFFKILRVFEKVLKNLLIAIYLKKSGNFRIIRTKSYF